MKLNKKVIIWAIILLIVSIAAYLFIARIMFELEVNSKPYTYFISNGDKYLSEKKYSKALAEYEKAIFSDRNNYDGYLKKAQTYIAEEKSEKAILEYRKVCALNIKESAPYYEAARYLKYMTLYEEALKYADKAIEYESNKPYNFILRASIYSAKGDIKKAESDYLLAEKLNPKDPMLFMVKAQMYHSLKDYDKCIQNYTRFIELDPESSGYAWRRDVYSEKKDYKNALSDANKEISLHPKSPQSYYARGNIYLEMGEKALAESDHKKGKALEK